MHYYSSLNGTLACCTFRRTMMDGTQVCSSRPEERGRRSTILHFKYRANRFHFMRPGLAALLDDSAQPQDRKSEAARRWREDVFEPAKRSDRLSWMLVGLAITLAHELGVFDAIDYDVEPSAQTSLSDTKTRIRRLLYLYSHQLSLRLGCPNMFPQGDHVILPPQSATNSSRIDQPTKDRELLLSKWIEITKLLSTATHMFFPSKSATKTMLRSYRYVSLVEHFHPLLSKWRDDYEAASLSSESLDR